MSKHILLVDDNPAVRKFLRNYLESEPGIEICGEACDGIDAVDKALTLGPDLVDLVVMDLSMPQMNGLEASRKLKEKLPGVPIVLFTSHSGVLTDSDAAGAGISAIISKADSPELLKSQVVTLLEMSSLSLAKEAL
jgi:DNA-binding NarL/FixJ family response regulator